MCMKDNTPPYHKRDRIELKHNGRIGVVYRCRMGGYGRRRWWLDVEWESNGGLITKGIDVDVVKLAKKQANR